MKNKPGHDIRTELLQAKKEFYNKLLELDADALKSLQAYAPSADLHNTDTLADVLLNPPAHKSITDAEAYKLTTKQIEKREAQNYNYYNFTQLTSAILEIRAVKRVIDDFNQSITTQNEQKDRLNAFIEYIYRSVKLSKREQEIFYYIGVKGMATPALAKRLNLSKEWIKDITKSILSKLAHDEMLFLILDRYKAINRPIKAIRLLCKK